MPAGVNLKSERASNDAVFLEQARDATAGGPVRDIYKRAFSRKCLIRLRDSIPQPDRGSRSYKYKQQKKSEQKLQSILTRTRALEI